MDEEVPGVDGPVVSVSELNAQVKGLLEREPSLRDLWVRGEVSNWRGPHPGSGHCYFRLKDDGAEIDAVIWRTDHARLECELEEGMAVLAKGTPTVYERGGRYQLIIRSVVPEGVGDLAVQFQVLKKRLEKDGLFAEERKRPLPPFPLHVGIVTSKGAAALQDVLNVLRRRSPHLHVVHAPSAVQGEGASATIVAALDRLVAYSERAPLDVVLVVRGGGSLEDLWAFNEEPTVRAIAACPIPVIVGVGHETDWTLSDLAADERAPTPSAAAERAAPGRADVLGFIGDRRRQLASRMAARIELAATRLARLAERPVLARADALFAAAWQRTDDLAGRLPRSVNVHLARAQDRLGALSARAPRATKGQLEGGRSRLGERAAKLDALSPLKVLSRGYAVATHDGAAIRSITDVGKGDTLAVRVADGSISTQVLDTQEASR